MTQALHLKRTYSSYDLGVEPSGYRDKKKPCASSLGCISNEDKGCGSQEKANCLKPYYLPHQSSPLLTNEFGESLDFLNPSLCEF